MFPLHALQSLHQESPWKVCSFGYCLDLLQNLNSCLHKILAGYVSILQLSDFPLAEETLQFLASHYQLSKATISASP